MIIEKFQEQVKKFPANIAVKAGNRTITYSELNTYANQVASVIRAGDRDETADSPYRRVSLLFGHGIDMIIGVMGALKAGKTYVPLDITYPGKRLAYMLEDSESGLILTNKENFPLAEKLAKQTRWKAGILNIDNISTGDEHLQPGANINREESVEGDRPAYILYTSGSTGRPKGVVQTHRNVVYFIEHWIKRFSITGEDRMTMLSAFSHDAAVMDIFGALLAGATLYPYYLKTTANTNELYTLLMKEKITIWHSVPTLYRYFTNTLTEKNCFFDIRWVLLGGEPVRPNDLELFKTHFPNATLANVYGQSESSVNTICSISQTDISDAVCLGEPLAETKILLVGEDGDVIETMGMGEIVVASDYIAPGYWRDKESTNRVFTHDDELGRLYWTGDLGRLTMDGLIKVMGRKDFQIKIRGFRVETGEIESLLLQHEAVKEAVAIAKEDKNIDNYLCVYFVSDKTIPPEELREYLSRELPDYMMPRYFISLEKMPLTPNGKIDRQRLSESEEVIASQSEFVPPSTEVERKLAVIWQEVLEVEKVGINDDFIGLGGHSLLVISIISKIHREFNVELKLNDVFNNPTVNQLSRLVIGAEQSVFSSIRSSEKKDYYALSSAQKRFFILQQMDFEGCAYNIPLVMELQGKLSIQRFKYAFQQLIHRHESLRTAFIMIEDEPVQKIRDDVEFEIEYRDLKGTRGLAPLSKKSAARSSQSAAALINSFIRPFDLSQAPLLRVGLIEIEPEKHIFMVDMHHIVSDNISMNLLTKEFITIYSNKEPLPLRLQYTDYCEWQHHLLTSGNLKQQENYWLMCFSGDLPVLRMPTDYPRPAVQQFEGDCIQFSFEEELTQSLKGLMRETGVTLFMVLLAVYNILLSKYTDRGDITIGTPTAGRNHADLARVIGLLVETLAIRNYPGDSKTVEEFLGEVKENALNAYENQVYPFGELIKHVWDEKDRSRNPLFDAMLNVQNLDTTGSGEESGLAVLQIIPYQDDSYKVSKLDLTLTAVEKEDKILFALEYCTKLFKKETMQRLISSFKKISAAVARDKTIKLGEIRISHDLLTAESSGAYQGTESEFGF
jgi:amino acid adenylation domain-containing protein